MHEIRNTVIPAPVRFDGNRGEFTFRSGTTIAPTSPFRQLPPEVRAQMDADVAMSRRDVETAVAASVPIIVSPLSHCYLDVPYAEPSADPGQAERQGRGGPQLYSPKTAAESFDWEPTESLGPGRATHVAGVEAAIWGETISDFDYRASCCCLGSPASPTKLGATRRSPPGPITAIASLGTADCGRKTASRTSAPPPCTGFSAYLLREED